jgi:2-methylcitrate dehydratase PrpD
VNEGVILHGGTIYEPKEVIEAQFSLRFSLAVRLLKGSNSLETYLDPNVWRDPRILETAKKIELFSDPTAMRERRFACSMKIKLASGRIIEGALSSPKGTHKNPFSKSEVQEKFFRLGSRALPEEKLNRVIEKVEMIEREDDVSSIIPLLIVEHRD